MQRDDDRRPGRGGVAQQLDRSQRPIGIEVGERLVEQQQARLGDHRAGEQDSRTLAGRQAADRAVAHIVEIEVGDTALDPAMVAPGQAERNDVANADRPRHVARGGQEGQQLAAARFGRAVERLAVDEDLTACSFDPGQGAKQAGLAAPVGADKRDHFAGMRGKIETGET